jgi:hypothetical protein
VVAKENVSSLTSSAPAYQRIELFQSFFYVFVSTTLQLE